MITIQGLNLQDAKLVEKMAKERAKELLKGIRSRKAAFPTEDSMFLTAVGVSIEMRMEVELKREAMFAKTEGWADGDDQGYDEVIVGAGPHAATWANVRALADRPRCLVVGDVLGGESFAETYKPWFRVNSRNRPGIGGLSSENAALNVIPGAPIQGENLNLDEYQTNSDLAYVVRSSLMRNADLRKGLVTSVGYYSTQSSKRRFQVSLEDGVVYADRVIDARGMGRPKEIIGTGGRYGSLPFGGKVWSFTDFAQRMSDPFPFQDLDRVAVIGGGDGGKVVVEALLGVGPSQHMSVPMLDWVEQVDWYGTELSTNCTDWRQSERGRYQRLGSFLRVPDNGIARLRVFNDNGYVSSGLDQVYVQGRPYDAVIVCVGYTKEPLGGLFETNSPTFVYGPDDGTRLANRFAGDELYQVGPRAELSFDRGDTEATRRILNNQVALFRTVPRTVQTALRLDAIKPGVVPTKSESRPRSRRAEKATVVGYDRFGIGVSLGDRVLVGRSQYTGTVVESGNKSSFPAAIMRDDGQRGGGPNGSWLITRDTLSDLEPAGDLVLKGSSIGYDEEGDAIFNGDRVSFREDDDEDNDGERIRGIAVRDNDEDGGYEFELSVKRDDGYSGGGPDSSWRLSSNEYDSLIRIG